MNKISSESKRAFFDLVNPKLISWEFYQQYIDVEPSFGQLGLIVFLRTYSRFIDKLKRREKWCETVLRNVEYSLSLDTVSDFASKQHEAEQMFDMMFNLKGFPSGRSLWIAGTKQTERDPSAMWNCVGRVIDDLSSFSEIFYWLLIGAGAGFSVEQKHIGKLPRLNPDVEIVHREYEYQKSEDGDGSWLIFDSEEEKYGFPQFVHPDSITLSDEEFENKFFNPFFTEDVSLNVATIQIGDSKEDWCNSLRLFLHLLKQGSNIKRIVLDYNMIRPEGTRIKTFGGRASGPKGMQDLFNNVIRFVRQCGGELDSLSVLRIVNAIALNVRSGGVRRSSLIGLGDSSDSRFKQAKVNLWSDPEKAEDRSVLSMSNNSTLEYHNPGRAAIAETFECLISQGDPGFWIIGNAQRLAESPIAVTNPCAEAGLDSEQSCNLTTLPLLKYVIWDEFLEMWTLDWESLAEAIKLTTRIASRVTLAPQWHPKWDQKQKRDRLLGVSMTGVMDAFDLLEWHKFEQTQFWRWAKQISIEEANRYHDELGIPRSTRITLMKPEGTISQLPTCSSGLHRSYAPYYLRRVRFSKSDPLCKVLVDLGFVPVPENDQGRDRFDFLSKVKWEQIEDEIQDTIELMNQNSNEIETLELNRKIESVNQQRNDLLTVLSEVVDQDEDPNTWLNWSVCNTWVFTFPIKTNAKIRAIDEPAIVQLERYLMVQKNWADRGHNVSFTCTFRDKEVKDIIAWIDVNWNDIIGISFLRRFDPIEGGTVSHPLMPYETSDEETVERMKSSIPSLSEEQMIILLTQHETVFEEEELDNVDCVGFCPIR